MLNSGKLTITIIEAHLTKDTEAFGSMDPYCKAYWGDDQEFKTAVLDGAGKTPNW